MKSLGLNKDVVSQELPSMTLAPNPFHLLRTVTIMIVRKKTRKYPKESQKMMLRKTSKILPRQACLSPMPMTRPNQHLKSLMNQFPPPNLESKVTVALCALNLIFVHSPSFEFIHVKAFFVS